MRLAKSVGSLNRRRVLDMDWTQYKIARSINLAVPYGVWDMSALSGWTQVFGPDPTGQVMLRKLEYDLQFQINNETSGITFSTFVVSLRPSTASQLVENVGANLANMTANIHYTQGPNSNGGLGQVYLNPEFFQIHKAYRFQISGTKYDTTGQEARNQEGTVKRISGSIKMKHRLINGRTAWQPSGTSTMPDGYRMYVLVFNDNSQADGLFPVMTGNGLFHLTST